MATNFTIDVTVEHFQQQRIIRNDPLVSHNSIPDHCCVKCPPPISGVTITISGSRCLQFLRKPPETTLLLSFLPARCRWIVIARFVNHMLGHNGIQNWLR